MSMPALLSHFGIDAARYVTTGGEIVFGGVHASAAGTFTHVDHGVVTPVANHTFHGGTDEPTDSEATAEWWHDEPEIRRHIDAMQHAFPHFIYLTPEDAGTPCWVGDLDTGRGQFRVAIVMRRDRGLPFVRLVGGAKLGVNAGRRWTQSPHLYLNGNLCVASQGDWNADEHTAATAATWAAHWLAAFTEWRMSRHWPTEGVRVVA
ncbi:MAG: hypothetical protein CVT68_05270 [Actinobacteria bacterium HGW-Actinobacteria-8]|nr:MAG: hypothetical protein CVT68_05270 [Actinobacteria bacterium HGW-Actinobacteria-8]